MTTTTTKPRIFTAQEIGANILAKIISHRDAGQGEEPPGSNSGPNVDPKLQYVGVGLSLPADEKQWCAAEASFDTGHALLEMGLQTVKHLCTASSHEAVNWAIENHTIQTAQSAVPGDWCILIGGEGEAAENGKSYHHSTVLRYVKNGLAFWTAGNTNSKVADGVTALAGCTLLRPYILPAVKKAD